MDRAVATLMFSVAGVAREADDGRGAKKLN